MKSVSVWKEFYFFSKWLNHKFNLLIVASILLSEKTQWQKNLKGSSLEVFQTLKCLPSKQESRAIWSHLINCVLTQIKNL